MACSSRHFFEAQFLPTKGRQELCRSYSHPFHRKYSHVLHKAKVNLLQQGKSQLWGHGGSGVLQTVLHPKARHRQKVGSLPSCCCHGKQEDLCSEAQAYGSPFGASQLVPAQLNCLQAHWRQRKFGGGERIAWLYPLLGNNSHETSRKLQASTARHQGERSPATIRAHHLQSFLMRGMLRAAAIS